MKVWHNQTKDMPEPIKIAAGDCYVISSVIDYFSVKDC